MIISDKARELLAEVLRSDDGSFPTKDDLIGRLEREEYEYIYVWPDVTLPAIQRALNEGRLNYDGAMTDNQALVDAVRKRIVPRVSFSKEHAYEIVDVAGLKAFLDANYPEGKKE